MGSKGNKKKIHEKAFENRPFTTCTNTKTIGVARGIVGRDSFLMNSNFL